MASADESGPPIHDPGPASPALPAAVAKLSADEADTTERAKMLGVVVSAADSGSRKGIRRFVMGPRAATRWALDTLVQVAPHLPIRDLETLRRHHDGKTGDALANALIKTASMASAGIGAAGGGIAAIEWAAPPTLLTTPVLIAAETVGVVAVEVKLIAELQEVYGTPVRGTAAEKAVQLLSAWAQRRGVSLLNPGRGMTTVLSVGIRKQLRDRLLKRMGRNLTTIGPLLTGAAIAGELNRRATRTLGNQVLADLKRAAR